MEEKAEKLAEYDQHLKTLGGRNSYSKTDPDATFMRRKEDAMNNGQTVVRLTRKARSESVVSLILSSYV